MVYGNIEMKSKLNIRRRKWKLQPDPSHVICRPHIPSGGACRISSIINRILNLSDLEADSLCGHVMLDFSERHRNLPGILENNFKLIERHIPEGTELTRSKKVLLGAYFSMEYSVSAAALFNPSIVPHPDQENLGENELRFIMSLRAVGEGHISSLAFRSGKIREDGSISFDPVSDYVETPMRKLDTHLDKSFFEKRMELCPDNNTELQNILGLLPKTFTENQLYDLLDKVNTEPFSESRTRTIEHIRWLTESNYEIDFQKAQGISERVLFPFSPNEKAGIEDARFVQFTDGDETTYYATYTAYDGNNIFPQLIETHDFSHFKISTFSGKAAKDKGLALFPRKVNGQYVMLGRLDGENNYLMRSDNIHCWSDATLIQTPLEPWEFIQLGNCGSPIETSEGWLVLTHGVGPMREYSIGAILLDLDAPENVIARLTTPLLRPHEEEREGYVPNVVYSCGSLVHRGELYLPYAMSDISCGLISINLSNLLSAMTKY
jgi:predicted GH43/DUF377 family glycosyl hydrolase